VNIPLSHVLHDFGRREPAPAPREEPGRAAPIAPAGTLSEDQAARMADAAFARGEQAGRAAAAAGLEARLAAAEADLEERLAAEYAKWRSQHADELAARLATGLDELQSKIGAAAARVLTPFLTAELRAGMIDALSESVRTLLSGGGKAALQIRGPEDLLAELREKLGVVPVAIEWEPSPDPDVRVVADHTTIETEMQKWIDRFAEAGR
jgi:hypothetical protein